MVIDRTTKLRMRRNLRRKQRQISHLGSDAEQQLDKHFFRRIGRLYEVRRFILSWLMLLVLLGGLTVVQTRALSRYYQIVRPLPGGIYSEGIAGSFTNANPIYATSEVDTAISKLLFASLFSYDSEGRFVPQLASGMSVDASGKIYTITLKDNLKWSDGQPLTADDAVFTFQSIQNPDIKSPLFPAWSGVKIEAVDKKSVRFSLPSVLASFQYSLTTGLLPKHVLKATDPSAFRSSPFNTTEPIGSGPFKWHGVNVTGGDANVREQRISLLPNEYFVNGKPKLSEFVVRTFLNQGRMMDVFKTGELTAVSDPQQAPEQNNKVSNYSQKNIPESAVVMAFFNMSSENLKDKNLRTALISATDIEALLKTLNYPSLRANSPLLKNMAGYDPKIVQAGYNLDTASKALDAAGWAVGANGLRTKNNKPLSLNIVTLDSLEYSNVARALEEQWKKIGIKLNVTLLNQNDLQTTVADRGYDVLLYGISLGLDPDQFAYWHSSQADVLAKKRLNFSNYSSKQVDASLEAGRTRLNASVRAAKYRPFLEAWRDDVPAMALYQMRYLYFVNGKVFNFNNRSLNSSSDRYSDVQNWMIRSEKQTK